MVPYRAWPGLAAHGITERAAGARCTRSPASRILVGHEAVALALRSTDLVPARVLGRLLEARWLRPLARLRVRHGGGEPAPPPRAAPKRAPSGREPPSRLSTPDCHSSIPTGTAHPDGHSTIPTGTEHPDGQAE